MQFSDVIQPVNLACSSNIGVDVIVMGNGLLHAKSKDIAPTLQYVHMKTISKKQCFPYMPITAFRKTVICAKGEENQSICDGDGGSPLIEAASQNLVGIAAFRSKDYSCDSGAPNAFTHVSLYLPWIEQITGVTCKKDA